MKYWAIGLRERPGSGTKKTCLVHRLVAEAFLPPCPSPLHEVAHRDGDINNNHYTNLKWATRQENIRDRTAHGTNPVGEKNARAKLSREDVIVIRAQYHDGVYPSELADYYGVNEETIRRACVRISWRHI
jgi:hypothetical protein